MLVQADKTLSRDKQIFGQKLFEDIPTSKTEKEIFAKIHAYKARMDFKEL